MRAGSGWRLRVGAAVGAVALLCAFAVVAGVATAGTQPISLTGVHPEDPAVSGTRVVWADKRYGYFDVFCYDSATGVTRRLTFGGGDHVSPAISGDTVVWADYRNGDADIWACDLATGVQRPLVVAVDDQIHPSISGKRLAWEDYRNGYNPAVRVLDVSTGVETVMASGYNQPAKRPRVSGDIVVWEDYAAQALGRTDPDVKACDLATGARIDVATTNRPEMLPSTDGRYVVWADSNGTDLDVRAYDTATGRSMLIGGGAGEQTYPTVAGGVAYWLDNGAGKRLHVDTYDFASGRLARFNDYGTSDVAAVSASGGSVAWLARSGSAWKIRALIPGSTTAIAKLSRLLPAPAPSAVRLAQMGAPASEPPVVISTSVRRGALNVPRSSSFTVYFSKSLDPSSVTPAAVRVLDARGRPLRGRVRYASLAKAVTFTPAAPLGASTYTLAVAPTLADAAGSRLPEGQMVTFSTFGILADTIPPTAPASIVASVAGTTSVMLSWSAAWDNVGATGYDVYRSLTATAIANFPIDASLIVSVGATTTATFPVKADEAAKAYCYYYVAVARDAAGNTSPPSYNAAPDPHGTYTPTLSTNLCMRCHSVHGNQPQLALGAKTAGACYVCHGNTPGTGVYGAASTFDTQGDFRDDAAIATTGPDLASGASIHRNAYMVAIQRECDACHSPHKRPFNYDPTVSYNRLLRTQLSTATYHYNTDAAAVGNQVCADCHGPSLTNVGIVGGATAYSDTGGDHLVDYAASAHSPSFVPSNTGDTNPGIQCEACHNNHSSATNKLVDYRASGTTTTANNQSGLCFKCHSDSGPEAGKPNTWNGRDVQAQFQLTSHHPFAAPVGSPPVLNGTWLQTLQADFQLDGLNNATATAGDSVQLSPVGGSSPNVWSDGFESGGIGQWDAGSAPNNYWQINTTSPHTGAYSANGIESGTSQKIDYLYKTIDLTGRTNPQLSYYFKTVGLGASDSFAVDYSTNGGAPWSSLLITNTNVGWTYKSHALPADANKLRFTTDLGTSTGRNIYLDDVAVTADAIPGGYAAAGTALSTLIVPPQGTVYGWGTLTVNGAEPGGTTMTVDVLDGSNGSPLAGYTGIQFSGSPLVIPLAPIDVNAYPTLMVRADFSGNAPAPRVVSDTFGAGSVDAATWTDALVGGGTDPDAGTLNLKTITFATALVDANSGVDTYTPTANNQWDRSTSSSGANGTTGYARCPNGSTAASHTITENLGDLTGHSSVNLSYYYRDGGTLAANERMLVEWSTNGGASWTALRTHSSGVNDPGTNFAQYTNAGLGTGANCMLRFTANITNSNDYVRLDEIVIDGVQAASNLWPAEGSGYLTLKAAGTNFGGTSDMGEFMSTSATWLAGDFDVRSRVTSFTDSNPGGSGNSLKAGIMVRTGTTTATANAANAANAAMFLTSGVSNGAVFQYRTTAGANTAAAASVGMVTQPEWVRLVRAGSKLTGYTSADGATWIQVGQGNVTIGSAVLVGVALTPHLDATHFSTASYDHFSVTEGGITASLTPRLDDWTATYQYQWTPTGSLGCVNCHNAHSVQKGGAGAWQVARVSDPNNTKNTIADTTSFCLACHDVTQPAQSFGANTIVPYSVSFHDVGAVPYFPGWDKNLAGLDFKSSGHFTTAGTKALCENCHDPHGSNNQRLTAWTRPSAFTTGLAGSRDNTSTDGAENNLCFECHGKAGVTIGGFQGRTATGVAGVNMDIATPYSKVYSHPDTATGVHRDTEGPVNLSVGSRHADCVDCHDPHAARPGVHTTGTAEAGNAVRGAFGVRPTWPNGQMLAPASFSVVRLDTTAGDYESYLCFKCHSSYVTRPNSPSGGFAETDVAAEFNPANASGHNVVGNTFAKVWTANGWTWAAPTTASLGLSGPWTAASAMTCSDCHAYSGAGARGPHGSANTFLLKYGSTTNWWSVRINDWNNAANMCNKCHTVQPHGNWWNEESDHYIACEGCHIRIPHGWKRPRLLAYHNAPTTDNLPYVDPNLEGNTGVNGDVATDNDMDEDRCYTNCGEHSDARTPMW